MNKEELTKSLRYLFFKAGLKAAQVLFLLPLLLCSIMIPEYTVYLISLWVTWLTVTTFISLYKLIKMHKEYSITIEEVEEALKDLTPENPKKK